MYTSMVRVDIGKVNVKPGYVCIQTDATYAELTAPGFVNNLQGCSPTSLGPDDMVFAVYGSNFSQGIFRPLFDEDGIITLQSSTDFGYEFTFFVAQNGDDANGGESYSTPLRTFRRAVDLCEAMGDVAGRRYLIWCTDAGFYNTSFQINNLGIDIFAPNATLKDCTFVLNAPGVSVTGIVGNNLQFGGFDNVSYDNIGSASNSFDNIINLTLKDCINTDLELGRRSHNLNFNTWDYNTCSITISQVNDFSNYVFNINNIGAGQFNKALDNVTVATWKNVYGFIGNVSLNTGNSYQISPSNFDIVLDPKWRGSSVSITSTYTGGSNVAIVISNATNDTLPIGFETMIIRNAGNHNIGKGLDVGLKLVSVYPNPQTNGDGGYFFLRKIASDTWFLGGDVQQVNGSSLNVYFSQINGDDSIAQGTQASPFATINAALAFASGATSTTNFICEDDATYDEEVSIDNPNFYLVAPLATLYSTTGDALTITTTGTTHKIIFGGIGSATGNCLVGTVDSTVIANVDQFLGGGIVAEDNTFLLRSAYQLGNMSVTGTGTIRYITTYQSGTSTPGAGTITGLAPT